MFEGLCDSNYNNNKNNLIRYDIIIQTTRNSNYNNNRMMLPPPVSFLAPTLPHLSSRSGFLVVSYCDLLCVALVLFDVIYGCKK